jgi:arylsulfatase A-like enzyme
VHALYAGLRGGALTLIAALLLALIAGPSAAGAKDRKDQRRPNVLIVNTDDQRAEGTMQVMPRTRSWLGAGGTTFTRAHATTPLCCPSRVSLFTGQYAHNHGVNLNDDPKQIDERRTIQSYLQRAGYYTGILGKFVNNYPIQQNPKFWSDARTTLGGYYDSVWNINGEGKTVPGYSTTFMRRQAERFVRSRERSDRRPWLLYVAPTAPHGPLTAEPRFEDAPVGPFPKKPGFPETNLTDKPPYIQRLIDRYPPDPGFPAEVRAGQLRTLMSVDVMMGKIRKSLKKARELKNTLVIFTSDNGLIWGERGNLVLKDMPYEESVRVPLMMSWPGVIPAGAKDGRLAANIDILPTLLDATGAGGKRAKKAPPDGRSLLSNHTRDALLLEYAGLDDRLAAWQSIVTADDRQYIVTSPLPVAGTLPDLEGGQVFREYYDSRDPNQLENPLGTVSPLDDPDVSDLAAMLARYRDCAGASCP